MGNHYVYILKCKDGTYYTGYAVDVAKRMKAHEQGKGAKYTRGRAPFQLVYVEQFTNKSCAMSQEANIKKLSREKKEQLIERKSKHEHSSI